MPSSADPGAPRAATPAQAAGLAAAAAAPFVLAAAGAVARPLLDRLRETASLKDFGAVGDGEADDTAAVDAWLAHLDASGAAGIVPAGRYRVVAIRRTRVRNGIDVQCQNGARFVGAGTVQAFPGDGRTRRFEVTAWPRTPRGFLLEVVRGDGEVVAIDPESVTGDGQVLELADAPARGETLRVLADDPMFLFASPPGTAASFRWSGGHLEGGARGARRAGASSAGSLVTIVRFARYVVADAHFEGAPDYAIARATGVADTGLTVAECHSGIVSGCVFAGWGDRGIYLTGGASEASDADDGIGHVVSGCFFADSGGVAAKRRSQNVAIVNCSFHRCASGASLYPAGAASGGRGLVCNNTFKRVQGAAVDVRWTDGAVVSGNRIVDIGIRHDGTPVDNVPGIYLYGASASIVTGNTIRLVDAPRGTQRGIRCADNTFGSLGTRAASHNLISGNLVEGCAIGYSEAGDGVGNVWHDNLLLDCATPVDVVRGRRWQYRDAAGGHEGIGDVPFAGAFEPLDADTGRPVAGEGRYLRQGERCSVRVALTGAVPARIGGLPYRAAPGPDALGIALAGERLAGVRLAAGSDAIALGAPAAGADGPVTIALDYEVEAAG